MAIRFFNEDVPNPVNGKKQSLARDFKHLISEELHTTGDINFIFCSDRHLLSINRQFLKHDYFTDIITFDYCENNIVSGDIYISTDRVKENAGTYKISFSEELNRIMIHGLLHLSGYDDKTPSKKKRMTEKENYYLKKSNFIIYETSLDQQFNQCR